MRSYRDRFDESALLESKIGGEFYELFYLGNKEVLCATQCLESANLKFFAGIVLTSFAWSAFVADFLGSCGNLIADGSALNTFANS
jgi:hypothetical protein